MDFSALQGWIEGFSYPALLLLLVSAGLGAPVSEDAIMLAGGLVTAKTGGSLIAMMLTAYVGVLVGDSLLWRIGHKLGPRALKLGFVKKVMTPKRLEVAHRHFERHGALTVFVARFVVGARAVTFITAGMTGLKYRRFLLADALAAAAFVPALVWLGFRFGDTVLDEVESAFTWILLVVVTVVAGLLIARAVRRRRAARMEAALRKQGGAPFGMPRDIVEERI